MTTSANEERRERVLDAAVTLINRYGYDKTTVDDIAREAGVSKGAVYLHFRSKDALFEDLFVRELKRYAEEWMRLIENDPNGGTIGAMYKNSLYAMNNSPFMSAMFRQDRRVFGNYLQKPGNFFARMQQQQKESSRYVFVKMMQDAGAVRSDIDARVIAHIMNIIGYGMVGVDAVTPAAETPPIDDVIEGIAAIMDAALTPAIGGDSSVGKTILRQVFEAGRQRYGESANEKGTSEAR